MRHWVILISWFCWMAEGFAAPIVDGRLDLSQEVLSPKTRLDLSGPWRFYPYVFLDNQDFDEGLPLDPSSVNLQVPGDLSGLNGPDGQPMPNDVWGSFVLELKHLPQWSNELGMRIRGDTAYRVLWIDPSGKTPNQIITQAGLPGPRAEESIPQVIEQLGRFVAPAGDGPYYIVIQLSGFHYLQPSLWTSPILGPYRVLERDRDWVRMSECMVVAMLLIMALYNFSLYVHRREDVSSLWLAGYCTSVMLRFISTSGFLSAFLFPKSSANLFELVRKVEFSCMMTSATCLLVFVVHTFGFKNIERKLWLNHLLILAVCSFVFLTDATVYPQLLKVMLVYSVAVSLTVLCMVIISIKNRKEGSVLALVGVLSIVICGWHDVLIGLGRLQTPVFMMPYGMIALIFSQGQVIAKLFSSAFRTADRLSRHLAEEVERQTLDIRSMLDHIPQGVMNLVPPGVIDAGFSLHLREILSLDEIGGLTLDEVLLARSQLNTDDRERIQAALSSCLGEDALAFELNSAQLPAEIRLELVSSFKILQMTWNPVLDKNGQIVKILITCLDVTEVRRYEAEATEQRQELAYIQELVNVSADKFSLFYETSLRMLEENQRLVSLNRQRNFEILKILFVNMHTIKGAARTLGFGKMAGWLHEVEQSYALLLKDPDLLWNQQKLEEDVSRAQEILEYYRRVSEQKLGRTIGKSSMVAIDREFLVQHTQMLKKMETERVGTDFNEALSEAMSRFEELAFQDSFAILQEISSPAAKIANDLGKAPPRIHIDGLHCGMSFQAQQLLRKVFIHILRNALDHGIETTEERLKHGKSPEGVLNITLTEVRNRLQIQIVDDGRGLSLLKLERRGLELGILSGSLATPIDELAELIFYPGLSTADSLTEVSGRGIGMDAVKSFVEEAGGSIRVQIDPTQARLDHCPFALLISLPSTLYIRRASSAANSIPAAS